MKKWTAIGISLFVGVALAAATPAKKYPEGRATPFSKTASLGLASETLSNGAPFWEMIPFHSMQKTGASCSSASATIVLNALRGSADLTKDDELFTEESLLKCTRNKDWNIRVGIDTKSVLSGVRGTPLDLFAKYLLQSLNHCLPKKKWTVTANRPKAVQGTEGMDQFREALAAFQTGKVKIIANFDQGKIFQDQAVGHLSPVGAYDAKTDRVLILDTDRKWYEPYWVPVSVLWEAMQTEDSEKKQLRGYVVITGV
ncbi:MAG: hypothetical protein JNL01_04490 [Bdellovibrionales bacterium]|nr:hypothetical protein [Bdellovibrionales bacterium]